MVKDFDEVDHPIRLVERTGVVLNEGVAVTKPWTVVPKDCACPVPTEGKIKDHVEL